VKQIKGLVMKSESTIMGIAKTWGFKFCAIRQLTLLGGPFIGLFYNEDMMILAVKGTTPDDFSEFVVDFTINQTDAGVFLGSGSGVHEGFYDDIFTGSTKTGGEDTYGVIIRSLKACAKQMKAQNPRLDKVPLSITGHSLGAAMASLIMARFVIAPSELGDDIILRDSYVFGTPRTGDVNFCANFISSLVNLSSSKLPNLALWRVVDASDIVCTIPPGTGDSQSNWDSLQSHGTSVLNYGHIGGAIQVEDGIQNGWQSQQGGMGFHENTKVIVTGKEDWMVDQDKGHEGGGFIPALLKLTTPLIENHFPGNYLRRLLRVEPGTNQVVN